MAAFKNLDDQVIVTKGHLLWWRTLVTIFAANSVMFSSNVSDTLRLPGLAFGGVFLIIGLVMFIASAGHASTKAEPLSERSE